MIQKIMNSLVTDPPTGIPGLIFQEAFNLPWTFLSSVYLAVTVISRGHITVEPLRRKCKKMEEEIVCNQKR